MEAAAAGTVRETVRLQRRCGPAGSQPCCSICPAVINAVVSRGGRPDLAGSALDNVLAPTLLIVGGDDHEVIELIGAEAHTPVGAAIGS